MPHLLRAVVHVAILFFLSPLLQGVVAKTKAWFAGRRGAPVWQPYADLWRLLHKGAVYSPSTSWVFRAGPVISLASVVTAGLLVPLWGSASVLAFPGDIIAFAYLLGLARFFTMVAALDTGSSFEGMGASREAAFSAMVEPALFLVLGTLALKAKTFTLSGVLVVGPADWHFHAGVMILALLVLSVVLLVENSRIPFDDPNTHLELTMIHEVMILDHSGPDLAFLEMAAAIKLFLFCTLVSRVAVPFSDGADWWNTLQLLLGSVAVAVLVGIVESTMARLRLTRVFHALVTTGAVAAVTLMVLFISGR